MEKFSLNRKNTLLVIVDIQERLAPAMDKRKKVTQNCLHLIEGARLLDLQIVVTEQYPKGLGHTVAELRDALPVYEPLEKMTFDCCKSSNFVDHVAGTGKKQIILTGMETHVCVLQTCTSLLQEGYTVHLVRDAVCSRSKENFKMGIEFMRDAGAVITGTETVLFQLLEKAGTQEFKTISKRVK